MTPTLPPAWQALLKDELQKPYWCSLEQRLGAAYESGAVYPPAQQLLRRSSGPRPRACAP